MLRIPLAIDVLVAQNALQNGAEAPSASAVRRKWGFSDGGLLLTVTAAAPLDALLERMRSARPSVALNTTGWGAHMADDHRVRERVAALPNPPHPTTNPE